MDSVPAPAGLAVIAKSMDFDLIAAAEPSLDLIGVRARTLPSAHRRWPV